MTSSRRILAVLVGLAAIAACGRDLVAPHASTLAPAASSDRNGRDPSAPNDPDFLSPARGAPTIANPVIQFWAVKGQDTRVRMVYHQRADGTGHDSVTFADFRIRAKSLEALPDGTPIADGDSVLITMTLSDPTRGIIDFQPSGLRFSAKDPASLTISFENSNLDLNGDGRVDVLDRLIELTLHIAVREAPNDPWVPLPSIVNTGSQQVSASLFGFSGYAIDF